MARRKKSGLSPYQRHEKAPYRYSELYYRWRGALKDGRAREASQLGREHTARFMGALPSREAA